MLSGDGGLLGRGFWAWRYLPLDLGVVSRCADMFLNSSVPTRYFTPLGVVQNRFSDLPLLLPCGVGSASLPLEQPPKSGSHLKLCIKATSRPPDASRATSCKEQDAGHMQGA